MPAAISEMTMGHAEVKPTLRGGEDDARKFLKDPREAGMEYEDVLEVLEQEIVKKFSDSLDGLFREIKYKARKLAHN